MLLQAADMADIAQRRGILKALQVGFLGSFHM